MAGRNYSSHKFSQVLRKDGTLDVDKLARECSRDVFEDKRHRRVDDMKKKAIGTSRDYDEFRNFVHCAEDMLEPVSSRRWRSSSGAGRAGRDGRGARLGETGRRAPRVRGSSRGAARSRGRARRDDATTPATLLESTATGAAAAFGPGPATAALARRAVVSEKYRETRTDRPRAALASELDATLVAEVLDTVCRPWVEVAAAAPPPPPAGEGAAAPPPPLECVAGAARAPCACWSGRAPRFSLNLPCSRRRSRTIGRVIETAGAAAEGTRRMSPPPCQPSPTARCDHHRHLRRCSDRMVRGHILQFAFLPPVLA